MKARVLSVKPVKKPRTRLIAMTGTPVSERPDNAYGLIRLIEPELAVSKSKFGAAFVETEETFFGGRKQVKVKAYRNLDKLKDLLATISIRRETAEGMPEVVTVRREVTLNAEQRKAYNLIASQTKAEAVSAVLGLQDLGSKTLRLRQCLNDPRILGFEARSSKFDMVETIADEVLQDPMAKMVVWVNYIGGIPNLLKQLAHYKPIAIYEETTKQELERLNATFDHSDDRIVVATPQKGGTGLDYLSRARTAVEVDLPWSFTLYRQSQYRLKRRTDMTSNDPIERIKSSHATIIELYTPGSVDALVRSVLDRKIDLVDGTNASVDQIRLTRDELLSFIQEIK